MFLVLDCVVFFVVGIFGVWYGDLFFGGKKVLLKGDMVWNVVIGCMY